MYHLVINVEESNAQYVLISRASISMSAFDQQKSESKRDPIVLEKERVDMVALQDNALLHHIHLGQESGK
jgi:hypothetical protein